MNPSVSLIDEDTTEATVLSAGRHLSPSEGACLMEVVSVAAGEPWSDSPTCTHPLLRHLAHQVNDAMSDDGRGELIPLVPRLARASGTGPEVHARLALACTRRALSEGQSLLLAHLCRVADAQLGRERHEEAAADGGGGRATANLRRALFERGPAVRAIEASVARLVQLPQPERDRRLADLLRCGLATVLPAP
jgi:hypothetical protein